MNLIGQFPCPVATHAWYIGGETAMYMFKGIKIIIQDDDFKVGIGLLNCLTGFFSRKNHIDFGFWILDFGFWILDWDFGLGLGLGLGLRIGRSSDFTHCFQKQDYTQ
jgi:hypothetical protein